MQYFLVSRADESSAADFKADYGALVACDVCDKWCVFVCFLLVPCVNVFVEWHCEFENVECFAVCVLNDNIWFEPGNTEGRWDGAPPGASHPGMSL